MQDQGLARTLPFPVAPRIQITAEEPGWHNDHYRQRAEAALARMERAFAKGHTAKGEAARSQYLYNVHCDRLAKARGAARDNGLRLDPMGRGPLPDHPVLHYRDRLPWGLVPLPKFHHDELPDRATSVVETWNALGDVFDGYVLADEPPGVAPFPTHCLIGAISADGRSADWFV